MDFTKELIDIATAGGFTALVWYLVVRHIPSITAAHQKEREEWLSYIKSRDAKYESMLERCMTAIEHNGK